MDVSGDALWLDDLVPDFPFDGDLSDCDFEELVDASWMHDKENAPPNATNQPGDAADATDRPSNAPNHPGDAADATDRPSNAPVRPAERPKRRYDREKARLSRERNRLLRKEGLQPPPPYQPKDATLALDGNKLVYSKKRKYEASGRYVGANVKKGGGTRTFKKNPLKYMQQTSKFFENLMPKKPKKKRTRRKRGAAPALHVQDQTSDEAHLRTP
jgi:hypothetical protein